MKTLKNWMPQIAISGYFTKEIWLRGQPLTEIEARLGFERGRLNGGGAAVYRLIQLPGVDDFEFAGYTHWPNGKPVTPGPSSIEGFDQIKLKRALISSWVLSGPERLVKVVPAIPHGADSRYPPGSGVHQWRISEAAANQRKILGKLVLPCIAAGGRYVPED